MNIYFFINKRLKTIRFFYDAAAEPFIESIRKIDNGEEPYNQPSDYDGAPEEPPFLEEWQLNVDALPLLGHSGIAMVQITLQLYLDSYKQKVEVCTGSGGGSLPITGRYAERTGLQSTGTSS